MDPADAFAQLKSEIRRLEDRAQVLRDDFVKPGMRLRSNRFEVTLRQQTRRVFQKDRLPPEVLNDPAFWAESTSPIVTVREIAGNGATQGKRQPNDLLLIEPF